MHLKKDPRPFRPLPAAARSLPEADTARHDVCVLVTCEMEIGGVWQQALFEGLALP